LIRFGLNQNLESQKHSIFYGDANKLKFVRIRGEYLRIAEVNFLA